MNQTFIFNDMRYIGEMYPNVVRIQKCVTVNTVSFPRLYHAGTCYFRVLRRFQHRPASLPRDSSSPIVFLFLPAGLGIPQTALSDSVRDRPGSILPHDAGCGGAIKRVQTGADPQQIHSLAAGFGYQNERVEREHVHLCDGLSECDKEEGGDEGRMGCRLTNMR